MCVVTPATTGSRRMHRAIAKGGLADSPRAAAAHLDGMAEHEHYGFEPADTVRLFTESGLTVHRAQRFQLGL